MIVSGDWVLIDVGNLDGCAYELNGNKHGFGHKTLLCKVANVRSQGYRSRKNARDSRSGPVIEVQCPKPTSYPHTHHIRESDVLRVVHHWNPDSIEDFLSE